MRSLLFSGRPSMTCLMTTIAVAVIFAAFEARWVRLCWVGTAQAAVAHDTPLDTALAAMAKEEASPIERVRLFIQNGDVSDAYYVDRVRPGRTHVMKNPRLGGTEIIVIGTTQWARTDGDWEKSEAGSMADIVLPSIAGLLKQGLTGATETPQPDGGRIIEGVMTWSAASACKGQLQLHIDRAGLPALMNFNGTCGGHDTRFRQAYSFAGPLSIEPPK
jgi:hypothetical protein